VALGVVLDRASPPFFFLARLFNGEAHCLQRPLGLLDGHVVLCSEVKPVAEQHLDLHGECHGDFEESDSPGRLLGPVAMVASSLGVLVIIPFILSRAVKEVGVVDQLQVVVTEEQQEGKGLGRTGVRNAQFESEPRDRVLRRRVKSVQEAGDEWVQDLPGALLGCLFAPGSWSWVRSGPGIHVATRHKYLLYDMEVPLVGGDPQGSGPVHVSLVDVNVVVFHHGAYYVKMAALAGYEERGLTQPVGKVLIGPVVCEEESGDICVTMQAGAEERGVFPLVVLPVHMLAGPPEESNHLGNITFVSSNPEGRAKALFGCQGHQ